MSRVLANYENLITQKYKPGRHNGIDIVGKGYKVDDIVSHSDGIVVGVFKDYKKRDKTGRSYGNYVKIKHENGYYTLYAHLKYGTVNVNLNDKVVKGQVIGRMGATGHATGIHLHFEVRNENDKKIDPTNYIDNDLPTKDSDIPLKGKTYTTVNVNLYVRYGPGEQYSKKLVKDLTPDGKKNATSKNPFAYALYKVGTRYTALDVIKNNRGIWAKTPSGYVCMVGASGRVYYK